MAALPLPAPGELGNILGRSPEPWRTGDLFFRKAHGLPLLWKQRKLTRSHSQACVGFVSGEVASAEWEAFLIPPHMVVCLIFLILNLCLLLGMKCEMLPSLCILSADFLHNSQEGQGSRCLRKQKITPRDAGALIS